MIITGDFGVGKTTCLNTFTQKNLTENQNAVDYVHKTMTNFAGYEKMTLIIGDTAGLEKIKSMSHSFYRGIACNIIMFDLSNQTSFSSVKYWLR